MKTIIRNISLLLCAAFVMASCHRKPLYDECICHTTALIPISVDWEQSEVTPKNVTVLVYESESEELYMEHYYEQNANDIQSYISLPIGEYKVVIFNELRNQIDYVSTSNYDNFSTLNFNVRTTVPTLARATGYDYLYEPGELALTVVDDLIVTTEMITYTYSTTEVSKVSDETRVQSERLLNLVAERKSSRLDIVFHIDNLHGALMPTLVDLYNISNGYNVSESKNNMSPYSMQFNMNNRTYDSGSTTYGTISTSVTLFGSLGDRLSTADHTADTPITLDVLFMMNDSEQSLVSRQVDITDLIEFSVESNGNICMDVYVDCDNPLPEVETADDESTTSGMETTVNEWVGIDVPPIAI